MKVSVLGAGRVGSAIARDLARDGEFRVTVMDRDGEALEALGSLERITCLTGDLGNTTTVTRIAQESDIVVGALPGALGLQSIQSVLEASRPMVDISFCPEDPLTLSALAREKGVPCLVDLGIAPGCSNLLFGHLNSTWEEIHRFSCYVGGLPVERNWPWEYQAPFSPADVMEEYTRPARFITRGKVVTRAPLSDPEILHFPGVGTLEAFLTDGLRTLLRTKGVEEMVEKTLRYPGYRDRIEFLRAAGFLQTTPVEVEGLSLSPLEFTSRILFRAWQIEEGDEDITVMRMIAEGRDGQGQPCKGTWDLLDRYDPSTHTTSMARTTGYTCTAGVRLIAQGRWKESGVFPPEEVGSHEGCYGFIMDELEKRGVIFQRS